MPPFNIHHVRHHGRFYVAAVVGIAAGLLPLEPLAGLRIAVGGVIFFLIYLASAFFLARRLTTEHLRVKASFEDEGIAVIVLITLAAIALSLGSLALLLAGSGGSWWSLGLAIANIPLGWATLHTVMAFHYAHLFYAEPNADSQKPSGSAGRRRDTGGLEFPKTKEPTILDFIYYAFVVGMTAQVSDVDITSRDMRNTTTVHGVVSFFYNTVILAFAVNVVTRG